MADKCWVIVHAATGAEWDNGEHAPHFDTEKEAVAAASVREGTVPRQRDQPCLIITCGCPVCSDVYDESGEAYIVHFDNAEDAGMVTEADWTKHPDGTYRCVACSPGGDCDCLLVPASQQSGEEA